LDSELLPELIIGVLYLGVSKLVAESVTKVKALARSPAKPCPSCIVTAVSDTHVVDSHTVPETRDSSDDVSNAYLNTK